MWTAFPIAPNGLKWTLFEPTQSVGISINALIARTTFGLIR